MFHEANAFNQDIGDWNTSSVTNMASMFTYSPFNQDIGGWDVSNVTSFEGMFTFDTSFNQDISAWDLSSATTINGIFLGASSFNQDIGNWNTSSVTGAGFISALQSATSFNQDIGDWDVSNATTLQHMFLGATSFDQDLSGWCVSNIQTESIDFSTDSALSESNKPLWGTCPTCNIASSVTTGALSQTVTQSTAIVTTTIDFTTTCTGTLGVTTSGLPPGILSSISSNSITLYGFPSNQASGTYNYSIQASNTSGTSSATVTGTLTVSNSTALDIIDKVRIIDVYSPSDDRIYSRGEQISINIVFSDLVYVTGSPYIEIDTGWRVGRALYSGGSGTSTLTFEYTVTEYDEVSGISYINQNSLVQGGRLVPWGSSSSGGVFTVGAQYSGYDNNIVSGLDSNVLQVYPLGNEGDSQGFAAYRKDNSFITWGSPDVGALYPNTDTQQKENIGTISSDVLQNYLDGNIIDVTTTYRSLAILKNDGSVSTWGDCDCSDLFTWEIGTTCSIDIESNRGNEVRFCPGESIEIILDVEYFNCGLEYDNLDGSRPTSAPSYQNIGDLSWEWLQQDGIYRPRIYGVPSGTQTISFEMYSIEDRNVKGEIEIRLIEDSNICSTSFQTNAFTDVVSRVNSISTSINQNGIGNKLQSEVLKVYASATSFAALKKDGTVVTWGNPRAGGLGDGVNGSNYNMDESTPINQIKNVKSLHVTDRAIAALKYDGSVITWGGVGDGFDNKSGGDSSLVSSSLSNSVSQVFSTGRAFAALKSDGSVITWGGDDYGGDSSSVSTQLQSNVIHIFTTRFAFAALKSDGSLVVWGNSVYGPGDSSSVSSQLQSGVVDVQSTEGAFAALKNDGSIVVWGRSGWGNNLGNISSN